jgi:hypothetical protein
VQSWQFDRMKRLVALLLLSALPASAGEITSAYSDVDLAKCKAMTVGEPEDGVDGGEWLCDGVLGNKVQIWEGDLRNFVGFGEAPPAQCASMQTFFAFNTLGPKVEWRVESGKPFATILRWMTNRGDETPDAKQDWLVVTKVDGRDGCHAAYIDATLPNANELAREAADNVARTFKCEKDTPPVTAKRGGEAGDYASGIPCPGGPYREE